ncbi:hypothetical protein [Hyphomicrobium sp. 99]|uniref:hypothetical protein n=1 Tax=Hyphomicrobium sp. 99 TaxID=1163419 RepID=UPI0012E01124|nr:hypothetical protein [Hyphomicrobium sp. 99]
MAAVSSLLASAPAYAVSDHVRLACRDDYYQHCSQFSIGTEELHQCMRKVGEGLSAPCLVALVQAGEITQADVQRHNAAKSSKNAVTAAGDPGPKAADDPKDVSSKNLKSKKAAKAASPVNTGKTANASKTKAAGSKAKPGGKTKTKNAAGASADPATANKKVSASSTKKTAKKLSSAKPGNGTPATTKPVATKKIKKVPVDQAP